MTDRYPNLRQVKVASPCGESWAGMTGDDRVRFCASCKHKVYNLSEMSAREAERLLLQHEGRLCVRYYQRQDGTIMTVDCPVGLARVRKAVARTFLLVASLLFSALGLGQVLASKGVGVEWINQKLSAAKEPSTEMMGEPKFTTGVVAVPQQQMTMGKIARK